MVVAHATQQTEGWWMFAVYSLFLLTRLGQLVAFFYIHLMFLAGKIVCISKREIHIMLKLCPNISIALKQIHIFKINVIA